MRHIQNRFARPRIPISIQGFDLLLRVDIRCKIREQHIVIAMICQRGKHRLETLMIIGREVTIINHIQRLFEFRVVVVEIPGVVTFAR